MVYMLTFGVYKWQMLPYIPYIDPMGFEKIGQELSITLSLSTAPELIKQPCPSVARITPLPW